MKRISFWAHLIGWGLSMLAENAFSAVRRRLTGSRPADCCICEWEEDGDDRG